MFLVLLHLFACAGSFEPPQTSSPDEQLTPITADRQHVEAAVRRAREVEGADAIPILAPVASELLGRDLDHWRQLLLLHDRPRLIRELGLPEDRIALLQADVSHWEDLKALDLGETSLITALAEPWFATDGRYPSTGLVLETHAVLTGADLVVAASPEGLPSSNPVWFLVGAAHGEPSVLRAPGTTLDIAKPERALWVIGTLGVEVRRDTEWQVVASTNPQQLKALLAASVAYRAALKRGTLDLPGFRQTWGESVTNPG